MTGLATFNARVLVLSRKDYPMTPKDTLSAVSPVDLVVAWGTSARPDVLKGIEIRQADRRLIWRAGSTAWAKPEVRQFTHHSGNWHMIPATLEVARDLAAVKTGDTIRVEGELVQVDFDNGVYFRSSLSRDDEGDGACEIIRATAVVVQHPAHLTG